MRVRLATLALLALSCSFEVDKTGTRFRCKGGDCPVGFECEVGTCVEPGASPDGALASCLEQYGDLTDFALCDEAANRCEFFGNAGGDTCNQLCAARRATCLTGYEADDGMPCIRGPEDGCDAPHDHLICICTQTSAAADSYTSMLVELHR